LLPVSVTQGSFASNSFRECLLWLPYQQLSEPFSEYYLGLLLSKLLGSQWLLGPSPLPELLRSLLGVSPRAPPVALCQPSFNGLPRRHLWAHLPVPLRDPFPAVLGCSYPLRRCLKVNIPPSPSALISTAPTHIVANPSPPTLLPQIPRP
jgi:hypothetical protein